MSWDPELTTFLPYEPETLFDDGPEDVLKSYVVNPPFRGPQSGFSHEYFNVHDYQTSPLDSASSAHYGGALSDAIGSWPQRFLHVPTMTSYEWTSGNIYGDHIAPRYNAISYTWGRFDLEYAPDGCNKTVLRKTKSIKIEGTTWTANIPRIDPRHFRVADLQNVIARTLDLCEMKDIELVWLDIACIDQRNGPQKAMEIGRQADIFKGAENVYIWLTRLNTLSLSKVLNCLCDGASFASEQFRSLDQETTNGQILDMEGPRLKKIRTMLDALFMDPWFTSLWTLQEAFLCPRAYLLSREATAPLGTLANLCHWCSTIDKLCDSLNPRAPENNTTEESEFYKPWAPYEKCLWEIKSMLRDRGLVALASRNPMALYAAAAYRKTRNEIDRVYAIQQVFGLRLGSSAPGYSNRPVHLVMLEFELGARMLEKYPVLSQMHVFNEPVEPGRGWKISMSSRLPDPDLKQNLADFRYVSTCNLTTQRASHLQWGYFSGKVCHFKDICEAWMLTSPPSETSTDVSPWKSPQWIALDKFLRPKKLLNPWISPAVKKLGTNTWDIKDLATSDLPQYSPTGDEQHKFASLIMQRMDEWYKDKKLVILYLGHFLDGPDHRSAHRPSLYRVGLILLESEYEGIPFHDFHGVTYWRRLGFCIWTCGDSSEKADSSQDDITANKILTVSDGSAQWREESGLFG